jgi:hypothetical protein
MDTPRLERGISHITYQASSVPRAVRQMQQLGLLPQWAVQCERLDHSTTRPGHVSMGTYRLKHMCLTAEMSAKQQKLVS